MEQLYTCFGRPLSGVNFPRYDCSDNSLNINSYENYTIAESQIVDQVARPTFNSDGTAGPEEPGILKLIQDAGIAITVLHSSKFVDPNFFTLTDPNGNNIKPADAAQFGFDGLPYNAGSGFSAFVHWTTSANGPDQANQSCADIPGHNCTFGNVHWGDLKAWCATWGDDGRPDCSENATNGWGYSGGTFLRPNGLMAELAFRTGGIYCPLLDPNGTHRGDLGWYIMDSHGHYRTKTEQARDCVAQTFGTNPYQLSLE